VPLVDAHEVMPEPYRFEALTRPWTCLHTGNQRPLSSEELCGCASCSHRKPRTLDHATRDLVIEAWGGLQAPAHQPTYDETRRMALLQTWGVE
jgi:hypothetical protein